jgi:phosphoribosylformimino-5-aminoimidazole carboxamide ribotide isomerase
MIIYPAIDIKDGQCVRLVKGDMQKATVFAQNPLKQAKKFQDMGFEWLHLVDLNGAVEGRPVNSDVVMSIVREVALPVQLGGGIRDLVTIEHWLSLGVNRVILGTVALKNPQLVKEACRLYPERIVVGVDARDGNVAVQGWVETSEINVVDLALRFEDAGVSAIIYTDIQRDGILSGPDLDGSRRLAERISTPVIVSGGISSHDDLERVKALESFGVNGVVVGRALYDGKVIAKDALQIGRSVLSGGAAHA